MVISRTPFRISFFGGGTDYPAWYRQHGGAVLATTIDKYCYLTCRYLPPFFEHRIRVVWSQIENCQTIDEIQHPSVRETLRYLGVKRGVEIHHDGDLPARSGMGSSSAFTVGLLHALHALAGRMPSKHQLAMEGIHVEQDVLKEAVGSQDQVSAAHGGLNWISFSEQDEILVKPVTIPQSRVDELSRHLMLFYTGIKRTAANIAETYDMDRRTGELEALRQMSEAGLAILNSTRDIVEFGSLLHQAWQTKRSLSPEVSNSDVDAIYTAARAAGAVSGKITGAGGGGFMLLFVRPEHQSQVQERLNDLIHVPFQFESSGSQIIFYQEQEDFTELDTARAQQNVTAFRELKRRLETAKP